MNGRSRAARIRAAQDYAAVLAAVGCHADAVDALDADAWDTARQLVFRCLGRRRTLPSDATKRLIAQALRHRGLLVVPGSRADRSAGDGEAPLLRPAGRPGAADSADPPRAPAVATAPPTKQEHRARAATHMRSVS